MNEWSLPLVGYWDQATGAINRNAMRLSKLTASERGTACYQMRDEVRRIVQSMPDDQLLQLALSMVDDLYKYMNDAVLGSEVLYEYLDAFGSTFTASVRERGYVVHYVVENEFSGLDFLMLGPFDLFARVFAAAGFVYICPQHLALQLMCADGIDTADYGGRVTQYIAEARIVADRLVTECCADARHYVFLEADYQDGSLDTALSGCGGSGVLVVFRNQAPIPGSEVQAAFPDSKLQGFP